MGREVGYPELPARVLDTAADAAEETPPPGSERPRVALATCADVPAGDEDEPALLGALAELGIDGRTVVWDDPAVDWDGFDLTVVRSAWDYAERRDDFLAWAARLRRVLNPLRVLEWNTDKQRYLTDLVAAAVPVVPTTFLAVGQPLSVPDGPFVVKPSVSAGGRSSARFDPADADAAAELVSRIHAEGRTAMVQPYLGERGETAVVYLGGRYSHAVRRRVPLPRLGATSELYLDEDLGAAEATRGERDVAGRALAIAPAKLLYARVDLMEGAVLELETTEPSLYLAFGDGATRTFAGAIAQQIAQR
jgi:glutathione synthase/RimK-type ligase-like ATP-grasp enzyme